MGRFFTSVVFGHATIFTLTQAQSAATTAASVISIFLPNSDPQTLVGSLISEDSATTVLAIHCPDGVDAADCGYPVPVTVTVGPSTFHASASGDSLTAEVDCKIFGGTSSAVCDQTYMGPAALLNATATDTAALTAALATDTSITSVSETTTLAGSEISLYAVTITAGVSGGNGTGGRTATGSDTPTDTASTPQSGSTSPTGTGSRTSTGSASGATGSNAARKIGSLGLGGSVVGILGLLAGAL